MTAPPARELTIAYGALTVSPDGHYRWSDQGDAFSLDFSFLVNGASVSTFATNLAAAKAAFRKPYQDLVVTLGGQTVLSFTSAAGTGLETKATILTEEHIAQTGRSARLTVRIVGGRPADNVTTPGLREYGISVGYTPNRRALVTISGVFTSSGSSSARTVYLAAIDALASAAKSALGISTWELIGEDPTAGSYHEQTLTFSRTYHEIKFGQGGSGDDTTIFEQNLRVGFRKTSAKNAPGGPYTFLGEDGYSSRMGTADPAAPLMEVSATYSAWVAFGTDCFSKWTSLRSFVISQMRASSGGSFAPVSEDVAVEKDDNKLTASISGVAVLTGVVSREFSVREDTDFGIVRVPAWRGNKYTKYAYQGPATDRWTRTLIEETASGGGAQGGGGSSGGGSGGGSGTGVDLSPFGYGSDMGNPFPMPFGNLFQNFGFGGETDSTRSGGGGSFYDAPVEPTPKQLGGGPSGAAPAAGQQAASDAEDLVSDSLKTEYMTIGVETPIKLTRVTRVQVTEAYGRLGTPAAFGAGPGVT